MSWQRFTRMNRQPSLRIVGVGQPSPQRTADSERSLTVTAVPSCDDAFDGYRVDGSPSWILRVTPTARQDADLAGLLNGLGCAVRCARINRFWFARRWLCGYGPDQADVRLPSAERCRVGDDGR